MSKVVLVVEEGSANRSALCHALQAQGQAIIHVPDVFQAMGVIGRADFGAVVARDTGRHLSLRGMFNLARKRHPDIALFVVLKEGSEAKEVRAAVGGGAETISHAAGNKDIARRVIKVVSKLSPAVVPLGPPEDQPTEVSDLDIVADATPADGPAHSALLEGDLDDGSGAALLVGVFAQELLGKITIRDAGAEDALFFHKGEPVWAIDHGGDARLRERLVGKGLLPGWLRLEPQPEGQLLSSLVAQGHLNGEVMHTFMRDVVRDSVLRLVTRRSGKYRFEEDRSFLDVVPLLKVNPMGLILEARRRSMTTQDLIEASDALEWQYVAPGPSLNLAAEKVKPFIHNANASDLVTGAHTVEDFTRAVGLDRFMGTLVVLAFQDAKLVTLSDAPVTAEATQVTKMPLGEADQEDLTQPVAVDMVEAAQTQDEQALREEIFAWYARLKPLTRPRQVLGVELDADQLAITSAYHERMAQLDPRRIPPGNSHAILLSRVEELRRKIISAYEALTAQYAPPAPGGTDPFSGPASDSNPF